ncbi:MAG TPA: fasciclin domain-containing protein [Longimicrobiales bacterium]|nr:fasciclin domain-containing protein [Longimicrobiales bacterium]
MTIAGAAIGLAIGSTGAGAQETRPAGDIVAVAVNAGTFQTLVAAVQAAGLVETLQGEGPFTVFAPTDEAFAKLPAGTVEKLLADPAALRQVLTYHVLPGLVMAADVLRAGSANPTTVQGQALTIRVEGGKVRVDGATVVAADVAATNGVIHVIDTVVLPDAEK